MPSRSKSKKGSVETLLASTVDKLVAEAVKNREIFREMAAKAYEAFDDDDRKLCKQLQASHVSMQHILDVWKERWQPIRDDLEKKRTDPAFARFIIHNLYLSKESAQAKINRLVDESEDEFLDATITELYSSSNTVSAEKRQMAKAFLEQNQDALEQFYDHFVSFTAYMQAAASAHVTIYDSMGSWVERQRALKTIRGERQKLLKEQAKRLAAITERMAKLRAQQNGLLGELIDRGWAAKDLGHLFDQYQKAFAALTKTDRANPLKQLAIFESTTAAFREQDIKRASQSAAHLGLRQIRYLAETIDKLLLRFFDLDPEQKQQLLDAAAEYDALRGEETEINDLRSAFRKHFSVK